MKNEFLVSVRCMTFNQSAYIIDVLNGFTIQQTDFPFVCCIMDDASTDGEQEVIRHYLEQHFDCDYNSVERNKETDSYVMNFVRHKDNKNCYFAVFYLKCNHFSSKQLRYKKLQYIKEQEDNAKYIAFCEGDDYWTDPNKLQKQVDIMEIDNSVGLVYTKAHKLINEDGKISEIIGNRINTLDEFIIENKIPTLTTCFRKTVYDECQKELGGNLQGLSLGDYQLWLMFAIKSKVVFYDKVCAVYRVLDESASHSKSEEKMIRYYTDRYIVQSYFIHNYPQMFKNKSIHKIVLDQLEWAKYRVYQRNSSPNCLLSSDSFSKLNLKHKLIYSINNAISFLGLSI